MTKSRQRFQICLSLFVLLCEISANHPSVVVCAHDAASVASDIAPPALKDGSLPLAESLSQGIRNAVEVIRPSLVTIRAASDRPSVRPLPLLLPEYFDDYTALDGNNDLPYFLRSTSDSSIPGTGVIVSEDGLIWTGRDVIQDRESVIVTLQNDTSFSGRVLLNDADTGLAIVKIDAKKLPSVRLEHVTKPEIADWAAAVAVNAQHEPIISAGFISSCRRENSDSHRVTKMLRFSFSAPDDCRGCAFVNLKGEFLGIQVPSLSGAAGSTSACVALDTESAMGLQRKILKETAGTNRELSQPISERSKSTATQGVAHSRKEGMASSSKTIREMFLAPRSEWTTAALASSVRNWLASWQDAGAPQARPASNASELR